MAQTTHWTPNPLSITFGDELPNKYLVAAKRLIPALLQESIVCPQSTASNQLRELMATLAKTWGDPIADVPK